MLNIAIENLEENGHAEAVTLFPPVGKLKRMLKAQVNPDSDYIHLSLALAEAEGGERNAALLVNQLASDMQMLRRRDKETKLKKRVELIGDKQQQVISKLEKESDELLKFVRENGSPETWVPILTNLLERHANVQEKLRSINSNFMQRAPILHIYKTN